MIKIKTNRHRKNCQNIPNNIVKEKSKQNIYPKLPLNQKFQWLKKYLQNGNKIRDQQDDFASRKYLGSSMKLKQKKQMLPYNKFKLLSQHNRSKTINKQNLDNQLRISESKPATWKEQLIDKKYNSINEHSVSDFNIKQKSKIKKLYLQNRNNIANILGSYRDNKNNSQLFNRTSKQKIKTIDSECIPNTNRFRLKTQADIKISNKKYLIQKFNFKKTKGPLQYPYKKNLTQYLKQDNLNRCYTLDCGQLQLQFKLQPWKNSQKKVEKTFFADTQPVNQFQHF